MSELGQSLDNYLIANGSDPAVVAARLLCRPHVLFRPHVFPDGDKWCALYGDNLQDGVAGFGDTPHKACLDFDKKGKSERAQASVAKQAP